MTLKSINSRYHHDYMLLQGSLARLDFFFSAERAWLHCPSSHNNWGNIILQSEIRGQPCMNPNEWSAHCITITRVQKIRDV